PGPKLSIVTVVDPVDLLSSGQLEQSGEFRGLATHSATRSSSQGDQQISRVNARKSRLGKRRESRRIEDLQRARRCQRAGHRASRRADLFQAGKPAEHGCLRGRYRRDLEVNL